MTYRCGISPELRKLGMDDPDEPTVSCDGCGASYIARRPPMVARPGWSLRRTGVDDRVARDDRCPKCRVRKGST